ncbi:hypothetical protein COU53_03250 [Candidatus Pacearchaeota archaeon CG10_big_fil_rev_8_21_14_0_10_30_48]|nr:MAG: hypothetical protein COU53_03250 [Candidatus Pacearchaeota archaeon CG10_big_fil_rev_8_21_14_0_10_30_48]
MKIKVLSILAVIILFLFLIFLISDQNLSNENVLVTKIIDGDTVIVQGGETIRLLGIDCDERGKECYTGAKNRIEEILLNQEVILEKESEDKDIYGRSLRYIFLNGENINSKMVKEGYCVARFPQESKYKKEIVEVEGFAISNKVGCKWSNI